MIDDIICFLGKLEEIKSHAEIALTKITRLWEGGNIRLKTEDLKLMRQRIRNIRKVLVQIEKYNHGRFSRITNEEIDNIN